MTVLEAFSKGIDIKPVNRSSECNFLNRGKNQNDSYMHNDTPNVVNDGESFKTVLESKLNENDK